MIRVPSSGPFVGAIDVALQDQTTAPVFRKFHRTLSTHHLIGQTAVNQYTITVDGSLTPGAELLAQTAVDERALGQVVNFAAPVATLDRPVDQELSPGTTLLNVSTELAVNGSGTPVIFGIGLPPGSVQAFDVTNIFVSVVSATEPDDSKFGDLSALTRGVLFRANYVDQAFFNLYNAKTNRDLKEAADVFEYTDKAGGGRFGSAMLTRLGGQGGYGVVVRVSQDVRMEMIVQDDLSALYSFEVVARGHIVD